MRIRIIHTSSSWSQRLSLCWAHLRCAWASLRYGTWVNEIESMAVVDLREGSDGRAE